MIDLKERLWKADDSLVGFKPKKKMRCPICKPWWAFWLKGPEMEITFGNFFSFDITVPPMEQGKVEVDERKSHAIDIWMRCPECGYNIVHGVPLHVDEFNAKMADVIQQAKDEGKLKEGDNFEPL